jgi:hypothetical protein
MARLVSAEVDVLLDCASSGEEVISSPRQKPTEPIRRTCLEALPRKIVIKNPVSDASVKLFRQRNALHPCWLVLDQGRPDDLLVLFVSAFDRDQRVVATLSGLSLHLSYLLLTRSTQRSVPRFLNLSIGHAPRSPHVNDAKRCVGALL